MTESQLRDQICDYLRKKGMLIFRDNQQTGRHFRGVNFRESKGRADILGCIKPTGRFLAIEVKVKGNVPSPEQVQFLDDVARAGGIAFLAYSLNDVMERI